MTAWAPQVFAPYQDHPDVLIARVAARSAAFGGTSAAGGAPVLVGSAAGHQRERVVTGARGELLERLGNVMAGREAETAAETVGTSRELRRRGIPVLEPEVRPDARRLWVRGRTTLGADVFVPAGSVFLHHRPPAECEALPSAGSTGVAANPDLTAAARHAAWEVLERDLVRRSWYGLQPRPPVPLTAEVPTPLADVIEARELMATAFSVPAPAGTVCAVVCLHRPDGTGQAFGARCGPGDDISALVETAAYEALMVRWSMTTPVARRTWEQWRGTSPPTTAVQHALWAYHRQDSLRLWGVPVGRLGPAATADEAHTGPEQSRARPEHSPVRLEQSSVRRERPEQREQSEQPEERRRRLKQSEEGFEASPPSAGPGPPPEAQPAPARDPLTVLADHTGHQVILVETTAKPAREAGVRVVRVLSPGALPLPSRTDSGHPHPFG
ncbi:YcaO-like family protein [Streptomyces albipurpureus]|uniref:YcaO-like family protein n=1 Tax=Streptomyces albipurpureus TaxID=2897419 RepID=A0ABT0UZF0_9ACTN|nr:YcaO-like family protein [Streptomyces sp. CWNU-1]MCM2392531.1 YcaO-like family protein [Streptomyces sp. CWNU-1]